MISISKLKEVLQMEDTILFVGSGISVWSNLPTWEKMMRILAEFCRNEGLPHKLVTQEASRGNLLQAASYGYEQLTTEQKSRFIQNTYHDGSIKPHKIHDAVVSLGPNRYITTNYDDLIEQTLRKASKRSIRDCTNIDEAEIAKIIHIDSKEFVFKPHGDASKVESIILTRKQYRELMPHGKLHVAMETLRILLVTRRVVYIGFGFREPDFAYLRDVVGNLYQGATPPHYAIVADVSAEEAKYWHDHDGINLTTYKTGKSPSNQRTRDELLDLLERLKR